MIERPLHADRQRLALLIAQALLAAGDGKRNGQYPGLSMVQ